jgi:hypothetical protein
MSHIMISIAARIKVKENKQKVNVMEHSAIYCHNTEIRPCIAVLSADEHRTFFVFYLHFHIPNVVRVTKFCGVYCHFIFIVRT